MSICAKQGCSNEHAGSKQSNVYVIRAYLCKKHLIESAQFDAETIDGAQQCLEWLKKNEGKI